jgi:hypothetical protein
MENLIYGLYCPIRKKPVYVGQTTKGIDRPFQHIKERSHSKKVNEWVHELKKDGLTPIIVILETFEDSSLLDDKERFWVQKFLNEGELLLNQQLVSPLILTVAEFSEQRETTFKDELALFVKGRRKILNLTQQRFCEKTGIGLRFLRSVEQGKFKKDNFSTKSIETVLYYLGARLTIGPYKKEE